MTEQDSQPASPHKTPQEALRAIDANLNRTREALRVIEDSWRFAVGDGHLSALCKSVRHDLSSWARAFNTSDLLAMRDSISDVGRHTEQASEYVRKDLHDVLRANFSRAQQSLRALEEFSKTINSQLAQRVEQLRYQVYELEKAALLCLDNRSRFENVRIYVLLDGCDNIREFSNRVQALVDAGADAIQLRDKSLDDRQLLEYGKQLVAMTRDKNVLAIINDRVDIAMAVAADGTHLGQSDMNPSTARQIAGPNLLIGLSTHNIEQAREAELIAVNYIGVGPTFESETKSFAQFTGIELLRAIAEEISIPAFAIGGINSDNIDAVVGSGCERVAVAGAIPQEIFKINNFIEQLNSALAKAVAE